ncbi:MAG TPA: ABC transporter permease [Silvibacterium sp.]|nr:ABC transporter permease [Silvibacterium sp.]
MKAFLRQTSNRFRSFFHKAPLDRDLDEELASHVDLAVQENVARGMTREEARRQAMIRFGGMQQARERQREARGLPWLDVLAQNARYSVRMLWRSPGFAAVAILILALGIGANSAVFSAIDAIVLRPLHFPHGDELVEMHQYSFKNKTPETNVATVRLEDWNRMNSTFQAISGYYTEDESYDSGSLPEKITEALVASRFLEVWGIAPELGRNFTREEQHWGGPSAVLISDRFWRTHLHGEPDVIGKRLKLGQYASTIVGVMPASFLFPVQDVDVWTPSAADAPFAQARNETWFVAIGRMKPGVSIAQARADMDAVQSQLAKQFPKTDADMTVEVQPLKEVVLNGSASSLWLVYGSVSLLLVIACMNLAALLLARTTQREHEIAVRFSLGASRKTIVVQLLSEVLALALTGAALGLLIAAASARIFQMLSKGLPRAQEIALDWRVAMYSLVCAVAVTLFCGLVPAMRSTRRGLAHSLAQGGRMQVSARSPLQWILVGVQVAFAVTLLIGAGLLLRSFQQLGRVKPGFDPSHVLTLRVSASWGETADLKAMTKRVEHRLDTIRQIPGVEAAATSLFLPGVPALYRSEIKVDEGPQDASQRIVADSRFVSSGYFATTRIPTLQGNDCQNDSPVNAAVVNRSFANLYLAQSPVLGHHVETGSVFGGPSEIRGVVGDAREEGLNAPPAPTVYWCVPSPDPDVYYLVRTHGDPMAMADTIRRKMHDLEPGRSVYDIAPLQEHLDDAFAVNRLRTLLLTLFAVTAVSLVSLGLYGTISYLVRVRQREVGLRLALGALPRQIATRFLLQGLRVAGIGCAAGLLLDVGLGRGLTGMLYGVSPLDAVTYSAVVLLILAVAALASLVPAMRAARVQPTQVLREE